MTHEAPGTELGWNVLVALGVYVLAKLAEVGDRPIFERLGGLVSGHTLKHLIAALATAALVWMVGSRGRAPEAPPIGAAGMQSPGPS
jgi:hypothetical protein